MVQLLRRLAESPGFQGFVTLVIIFAGVLVGLETYASVAERHGSLLEIMNTVVLAIFVGEILVKLGAEGTKPWRYFTDAWNIFDFLIVASAFMPIGGQAVTVLRLLRLLRVLRLVRALPQLQILVSALLKSIPSMAYVSIFLLLLFYIYAVAAVFLFGKNDPVHFANLQLSLVSLFRTVTLEDWTDLMYIQMYGCDNYGYGGSEHLCTQPKAYPVLGALFFISFVMVGTMIVLNLFIGVIMNGMDEAQKEAEEQRRFELAQKTGKAVELERQIDDVTQRLQELSGMMEDLQRKAKLVTKALPVTVPPPAPKA